MEKETDIRMSKEGIAQEDIDNVLPMND